MKNVESELKSVLWNHCVPYHPQLKYIPQIMPNIRETNDQIGDYTFGKTIGAGNFATVKYGYLCDKKNKAIKIIDKSKILKFSQVERISQEIQALTLLKGPYITNLLDAINSPKNIYLVLDLGPPDVYVLLDNYPQGLTVEVTKKLMRNILTAVEFMHSKQIYHLDIKPENILVDVDNDYHIYLCDFGLCSHSTEPIRGVSGSLGFFAPEMITKTTYEGAKADVWSIGVVSLECLLGHDKFHHLWLKSYEIEFYKDPVLFTVNITYAIKTVLHYFTENGVEHQLDWFKQIFSQNRPTVSELLRHPWIYHKETFSILPKIMLF